MAEFTSEGASGQPPPAPLPSFGPSFQDGMTHVLMTTEELRQNVSKLTKQQEDSQQQQQQTSSSSQQKLMGQLCLQLSHGMEELMHSLFSLQPHDEMENDLFRHCKKKAAMVARQTLDFITTYKKEEEDCNPPEMERDCQGAIARITEFNLVLHNDDDHRKNNVNDKNKYDDDEEDGDEDVMEEIISTYVSYQRQVIRQRAKPCIARLVDYRAMIKEEQHQRQRQKQSSLIHQGQNEEDDDDESAKSTHAHVITSILGQASSLIHPLMLWKATILDSVPPPPPPSQQEGQQVDPIPPALIELCNRSIETLNEQAQTLTQTVANWFVEDRQVDEWMAKSAATSSSTTESNNEVPLGELDSLVEELAFCCQIFHRYSMLLQQEQLPEGGGGKNATTKNEKNVIGDMHLEWTWKYATLERFLTTVHWQSALRLANPVQIMLGTSIKVPSVVEDAQYLSRRGLERAASTRSGQAIGTVAHSIASDVWSTDRQEGGVYHALLDQKGCWQDPATATNSTATATSTTNGDKQKPSSSKPSSSSFAAALIGALDDDLNSSSATASSKPAPSSGSFLGAAFSSLSKKGSGGAGSSAAGSSGGLVMGGGNSSNTSSADKLQSIRLDTYLCALNGIHSASVACLSLVTLLDSLLPSNDEHDDDEVNQVAASDAAATTMIQLAREELFRYSQDYQHLLNDQVARVVLDFCGTVDDRPVYRGQHCFPIMKYYLQHEDYNLVNAEQLQIAEDDNRLTKQYIVPLQESKLIQQLIQCDVDVLHCIGRYIALQIVDLFMDCLLFSGQGTASSSSSSSKAKATTSTSPGKQVTDWGSLLLSKQVRTIQTFLSKVLEKVVAQNDTGSSRSNNNNRGVTSTATTTATAAVIPNILSSWERLSQAVMVLQLEKPSDWILFYSSTSTLSTVELEKLLRLRTDFSSDAISAVVANLSSTSNTNTNTNTNASTAVQQQQQQQEEKE